MWAETYGIGHFSSPESRPFRDPKKPARAPISRWSKKDLFFGFLELFQPFEVAETSYFMGKKASKKWGKREKSVIFRPGR